MGECSRSSRILAIAVACLGLFGLIAFMTERRTKEIGIRKVLAASVSDVVVLMSKDFLLLVLVGNLIACPIAFYGMRSWLEDFAYHVDLGAGTFLLGMSATLVLAALTVIGQAYTKRRRQTLGDRSERNKSRKGADMAEGQVALIVGASSGMGRATARAYAEEGMRVALAARNEKELNALAGELGEAAIPCPCDVTQPESVDIAVARVLEEFGAIDILVYATGTNIPDRSLEVLTGETWEMMMSTNLSGAFYATKAVLPQMRVQESGLIIYLSTGAVQSPDVSGVAYQASKHGMTGLAHGTFNEERDNGVRTTIIFPGLCDTPLVLKRPTPTPPEVLAKALQPEDVAEACLFVASLPSRTRIPELILLPSGL